MVGGALIPDGHGVFVHGSLLSLVCLVQGRWSRSKYNQEIKPQSSHAIRDNKEHKA